MSDYPIDLTVDYPEKLSRLTTFFRLFTVIPILIVLALLVAQGWDNDAGQERWHWIGVGFVCLPILLMLLFRRKYPRWWFDWNHNLLKFMLRVSVYLHLLRDEYPSTDEEQAVHLTMPFPDATTELNRWMPLVKWFLAIPHLIVLSFLEVAAGFCVFIGWWAIMFTGRFPRGMHGFVVNVMRWSVRVFCYAILLTTDRYPPFSLD
jgi:hypothetical protein